MIMRLFPGFNSLERSTEASVHDKVVESTSSRKSEFSPQDHVLSLFFNILPLLEY